MGDTLNQLLQTNTPENNLLVFQLLKGAKSCPPSKALEAIFDFHWNEQEEDAEYFTLCIGNVELSYNVESEFYYDSYTYDRIYSSLYRNYCEYPEATNDYSELLFLDKSGDYSNTPKNEYEMFIIDDKTHAIQLLIAYFSKYE